MSHAFKPGDRAVVIRDALVPEFVGAVTIVTSPLWFCENARFSADKWESTYVYSTALKLPYADRFSVYRPDDLEPYRDDGRDAIEWTAELRNLCRVKENA